MNGEQAFERQLARWLQEGPYEAPTEPVATALAAIRAHPERPRAHGSLWRRVVSGVTLTHVPTQPSRGWAPVAVAIVVVALVVAGGWGFFNLGGAGGPAATTTPVITPAPTSTPNVTPTPRATRTVTPTLGPGMSTGVQTCKVSAHDVTTTIDGVVQSRGEVLECSNTSTDPRLAGQVTTIYNWDEHPDGLWLGWGTTEIRNDGGTWTGTYAIESTSTADVMEFDAVLIGAGDYDGLEVLNHVRITMARTAITSRVFEGRPSVTGTELCSTTVGGRELASGDLTAFRGVVLHCTDTMSDPRVSGDAQLRVSIDRRADESADLWGTNVLTNDDGSWEGFFFGTVDAGYTTHRVQALLRGTGAYAGLFYRLVVLSPDGANAELTGEIVQGF